MALQLEGGHVLSVAVVAGCVALPALTVLLFQLQVMLHVVHEPAERPMHRVSLEKPYFFQQLIMNWFFN